MNIYEKTEVGGICREMAGRQEGCYITVTDTGLTLYINFCRPTEKEIAECGSKKQFEFRVIELQDILCFTAKPGNLNWIEAPYSPQLNPSFTDLPKPKEGLGYSLLVLLTDAPTGVIKSQRLIGLSTKFSEDFYNLFYLNQLKTMDWDKYMTAVNNLRRLYTTNRIADMSTIRFKIK